MIENKTTGWEWLHKCWFRFLFYKKYFPERSKRFNVLINYNNSKYRIISII